MPSPTQRQLSPPEVADLAQTAFGVPVVACEPLSGGGFAAVWRVDLSDGRRTVAKIGPAPGVRLLRYEHAMIPAEAEYLAMGLDLPLPRLLRSGPDWIFSTYLDGVPLTALDSDVDTAPVRRELGETIARLHTVEGPHFGYTGDRPSGDTWRTAYAAMIEALLADAADWDVVVPADAIRQAVRRNERILDEVDHPALLHFDLWDGNVLADADGRLTGLVDGERWLYGDPLMDLVSPALYRRIEDEPEHPFLLGYADSIGAPVEFTEAERIRLSLYRLHMHLLMTVEMPSRGMTTATHGSRQRRLSRLLDGELAARR